MRKQKPWIYGLLLAAPLVFAQSAQALTGASVATDNVKARLVGEVRSVAAGQKFFVALELEIRDGWHTYWRNPGDSGQATKLVWTLPPGFAAGEIQWTTPHRFELPPLVNYGYAKHAVHLVEVTAAPNLAAGGRANLLAKASWLVCSDVCIPESADLSLSLPTSAQPGAIDPASADLIAAARAELPIAAPAVASARVEGGKLVIALGADWGGTLAQIKELAFFPYDDGAIDYGAPQTLARKPNELDLAIKLGYQLPASPIRGLLLATEQTGSETAAVPLQIAAELPAGAAAAAAAAAAPEFKQMPIGAQSPPKPAGPGIGLLLLFAILGGLVLNLMPCVFPVLSIKALGLVEQAKKHPAAVRTKGLVFAAGVISSMLALAVVLLALRAGGEQIGWGFQLQSPLFVTLMAYLLLGVGLNLSGVFEVGGGLAGIGDSLTQGDSYHASFFTGVLTTLVATPCTAPFMAAAVGAALTQSPLVALSIFTALGFGLSLPYLSLSFAPYLRRALPKPGAWMDTLKQVFAFPMYGSAAWLIWVLAQQQTAILGLGAALAGAILVGLAAWSYQKSKSSGSVGRAASLATAAIALIVAVLMPVQLARAPLIGAASAATVGSAGGALDKEGWQTYDATRVEDLKAEGKPVLVNFTASWCLTCLVNERNAFGDAEVQALFRAKGVTLIKGDWTNRDPAITKALADFGRAGVPLYLVYNAKPGSAEPLILPQLLSASVVRDAFAALPNRP
jgi:thiol:disulfide interchange protein/DsbC/DsbD-like thiol-disulfide interchange protein